MRKKAEFGGWETDEERLKKGMRISSKDKLIWLREINDFTYKALTDKQKEVRRKLRERH